jgi:hypothetical protein
MDVGSVDDDADVGAGNPRDAAGKPTADLFSDSSVSDCAAGFDKQYRMQGLLEGEEIEVSGSAFSYLEKGLYQHQKVVGGEVKIVLSLSWTATLQLDRAVPLTGESVVVPVGHPLAGTELCVTGGELGARLGAGGSGLQVLFSLTGAREGSCDGREVAVNLKACVFRNSSTLP